MSSAEREDSRKPSSKSYLQDFSGYSTLHGSYFVLGSGGIIRRVVWMVLVLAGVGICTSQLVVSFRRLRAYEHIVSKDIIPESKLTFPAVTICNINMMKRSRINGTEAQVFIDKLNPLKTSKELSKKQLKDSFDISKAVKEHGYKVKDLVRVCVWDGQDGNSCSPIHDFTTRFSYLYGQCHTFNSGQDGHPLLSSTSSERANGLLLLIEVKKDEYYGLTSYFNSGIRVVVHDQNEQPNIERDGIDIKTRSMTTIKIQRHEYNSLKYPYQSKCGSKKLETSKVYTRSTCILECSTRKIIKKCGCKLMGMANLTEFSQIKYCNPEEMISCQVYMPKTDVESKLLNVLSTLTFGYRLPNNPQECGCPRPCKEIKYSTRVNDADFLTSDVFLEDAVDSTQNEKMNRNYMKKYFDKIRQNLLHLSVYYEDLNTYVTNERPSYDINLFGADVGGYLGLFLGCSILTVFEFIDLAFVCCLGRPRQDKKKQENQTAKENGTSANNNQGAYDEEIRTGLFETHNAD
ncbi:acid-sensing ion channel 2 [Exaiptasia diaphana]|uniref:Uncharacterized protein n=1 Tax=Exaiptasia diaphana TaxID=2652724 RepID=A0A913XZV7_EXADI|nr:acid-sensing ion channel 2 [Exaiptasia diaphana]XP_020916265.1 acid-sensing ion channel 2 [Exaiptasia diaphana]KXJ07731.1 Acid-sensing ion channel 2 [Exaiptasia diaphana]KXJ21819.1 Acid-sensing ion channel 2 [Exaiptasia diaphana]